MQDHHHNTKRRTILFGIITTICIAVAIVISTAKKPTPIGSTLPIQSASQCYLWSTEAGDKATLSFAAVGMVVEGSAAFLPAEKDSKKGIFTGTFSPAAGDGSAGSIHGWWNVSGEGVTNKEEFMVRLTDTTAAIGFGTMKEEGTPGTYLYVDPTTLSYEPVLQKVDCAEVLI